MLTCAIIDDEKLAVERLVRLLGEISEDIQENIQILFTANSVEEFDEKIKKHSPDLLLLDIRLVNKLIFEVFENIIEKIDYNPYIVFVTAYDEYAIKAFENGAIDYVLKPVSKERLQKTIERVLKNRQSNKSNVLQYIKSQQKSNKLPIKYKDDILLLDISEIIYIMADNKDVLIVTKNGEYKYHTQLHALEEKLQHHGFVKIHKSYLISINHVEKIKKWFGGSYVVQMSNKDEIKISRKYQQEFFKQIGYQ